MSYQYSPTKTRTYWGYNQELVDFATEYPTDVYDGHTTVWWEDHYSDAWHTDTALRQGRKVAFDYGAELPTYTGNAYGTMFFGSGAGMPTELAGKTIISARIWLKRYSSGGDSPDYVKIWNCSLTDIPAAGAHSPNGNYVDIAQTLGTIAFNEGKWFYLPNSLAAWAIAGKCLVICYGMSRYMQLYGIESSSYKPILEITVEVPDPVPTLSVPVLNQVSVITETVQSFSWSPSSDSSGIFQQSELSYELQLSNDGGATWGAAVSVAAGTTLQAVDVVDYFTLAAHSYYPSCKFRVRAVSPDYEGTVYYSEYAVSELFAIDYRIEVLIPVLYDALYWVIPENDFGDAFTLKIINKIRIRGKGGTCGVTPKMDGVLGTRVEVELPENSDLVDVSLYAKGNTIGFTIDNGAANEDGGYDPIEIYDIQIPYDAEEE